jgi:hypothetical protein
MFKLMVPNYESMAPPHGYARRFRLEGAIGGTPDTKLIAVDRCHRSTLPPFLDSLVFNFVREHPEFPIRVQNFYHLGDFFVVSDTLKTFLQTRAGCAFEARAIRTKHPENKETERFWAMKVATQVDCILPDQSFAGRSFDLQGVGDGQSFSDLAIEIKLSADIAPYFANRGTDTYYAYPALGVGPVSVDFSSVPRGVKLFQPLYWPSFLVIDSSFSNELEKQCSGGALGYYFWTLGFDDVSKEYQETMHALR